MYDVGDNYYTRTMNACEFVTGKHMAETNMLLQNAKRIVAAGIKAGLIREAGVPAQPNAEGKKVLERAQRRSAGAVVAA